MDKERTAKDYLISLSPFLFCQGYAESALFATPVGDERQKISHLQLFSIFWNCMALILSKKFGYFEERHCLRVCQRKLST